MELPPIKVLVFDTETTGLPVKGSHLLPTQPWPVQVGAVVMDLSKEKFDEVYTTIAIPPEGTFFNPKATAVHGLTEEVVRANGIPMKKVMEDLRELREQCDIVAAYNLQFDELIIRSASERTSNSFKRKPVLGNGEVMRHCVMEQSMAYFGVRQKLTQVYQRIKGEPLTGAHDALADTVAAAIVMKELLVADIVDDPHSEN